MPEGDTIFRAARALGRALVGRPLTRFDSVFPKLNRVNADHPLAGREVVRVRAVGKHLLIELAGGLVLRTHQRMHGSWHLYRPGERWRKGRHQMRILLENAEYQAVAFNVHEAELVDAVRLGRAESLGRLGPDLLGEQFDVEEARRRFRAHPDRAIGEALLDQRLAAGAGNVYKSESLFLCGIDPFASVERVSDTELTELLETTRRLMQANVTDTADPGIATYRGLRRTTGRADPGARLWVYGRGGEPCRRCGARIERRRQGAQARVTFWCPTCQPGRES